MKFLEAPINYKKDLQFFLHKNAKPLYSHADNLKEHSLFSNDRGLYD